MGTPQMLAWVWQLETPAEGESPVELHPTLYRVFDIFDVLCLT